MLTFVQELVGNILQFLLNMLLQPLYSLLDSLLGIYAEAGALRDLLSVPWVNNLILGTQAIAGAVLVCRLGLEAFKLATLRAEGAPTNPSMLFGRTIQAALGIAIGPFFVKQAIIVGNELARGIANSSVAGGRLTFTVSDLLGVHSNASPLWTLAILVGLVLMCIAFIQAVIRTIEITLAAIISPFAALGYMAGGGMADNWIREVIILACSHALQMLLVYMSTSFVFSPNQYNVSAVMQPFYFLGTVWVALKTPKILRNYAYHTGLSNTAGSVGHTVVQTAIRQAMIKG